MTHHLHIRQICVVDREGQEGWGSSARFELSAKLVNMLKEGRELADVIDEVSGKSDVRSNEGAMGVVTNGNLTVFAFLALSFRSSFSLVDGPHSERKPTAMECGSPLHLSFHLASTGSDQAIVDAANSPTDIVPSILT